jgi:hypothetical protein
MYTDNPSELVDKVAETTSSEVSVEQLESSRSSNGVVERNGETGSDNSVQITEHSSRQDLLPTIWETMQQDRKIHEECRAKEKGERIARERREEEHRLNDKAERQKEREEDRKRLEQVSEDIVKTTEAVTAQFRVEIDILNDRIMSRIEKETGKLSEKMKSVEQKHSYKFSVWMKGWIL